MARRTQTRGKRGSAIDQARESTGTSSPWCTRSRARLNVRRSATRWQLELPSTPTGISNLTFVIERGGPCSLSTLSFVLRYLVWGYW